MQYGDLKNAGEALKAKEEISSLTAGGSMRPMLRQHKDIVIIKRIDRALKKGDVVLYPGPDGRYILHRIVSIKDGRYIMRGDNNYFTEKNVKPESIVGILKEFYREGKFVDCKKNVIYKIYSFYILHSYHLRYLWKRIIKVFLSKIKHTVFKYLFFRE